LGTLQQDCSFANEANVEKGPVCVSDFILNWSEFWFGPIGILLCIYQIAASNEARESALRDASSIKSEFHFVRFILLAYQMSSAVFGKRLLSFKALLRSVAVSFALFMLLFSVALNSSENVRTSFSFAVSDVGSAIERIEMPGQGPPIYPSPTIQRQLIGPREPIGYSSRDFLAGQTATVAALIILIPFGFISEFFYIAKSRWLIRQLFDRSTLERWNGWAKLGTFLTIDIVTTSLMFLLLYPLGIIIAVAGSSIVYDFLTPYPLNHLFNWLPTIYEDEFIVPFTWGFEPFFFDRMPMFDHGEISYQFTSSVIPFTTILICAFATNIWMLFCVLALALGRFANGMTNASHRLVVLVLNNPRLILKYGLGPVLLVAFGGVVVAVTWKLV
jgi:hypothetical protein